MRPQAQAAATPARTSGADSRICRRLAPATPPRLKFSTARARSHESWAMLVTKLPIDRNSDDRMNPVSSKVRLSLRWRTNASSTSIASQAPSRQPSGSTMCGPT